MIKSPAALMLLSFDQAAVTDGFSVPSGNTPMKFFAVDVPTEMPTPTPIPPPTAVLVAKILASILELWVASITTFAALFVSLPSRNARVSVRITLVDTAPAPLIAMPAMPATAAETEAAADKASMIASS